MEWSLLYLSNTLHCSAYAYSSKGYTVLPGIFKTTHLLSQKLHFFLRALVACWKYLCIASFIFRDKFRRQDVLVLLVTGRKLPEYSQKQS